MKRSRILIGVFSIVLLITAAVALRLSGWGWGNANLRGALSSCLYTPLCPTGQQPVCPVFPSGTSVPPGSTPTPSGYAPATAVDTACPVYTTGLPPSGWTIPQWQQQCVGRTVATDCINGTNSWSGCYAVGGPHTTYIGPFQCAPIPSSAASSTDTCETICGDGLIAGGEVCDDNNTTDGDGCSSDCLTATASSFSSVTLSSFSSVSASSQSASSVSISSASSINPGSASSQSTSSLSASSVQLSSVSSANPSSASSQSASSVTLSSASSVSVASVSSQSVSSIVANSQSSSSTQIGSVSSASLASVSSSNVSSFSIGSISSQITVSTSANTNSSITVSFVSSPAFQSASSVVAATASSRSFSSSIGISSVSSTQPSSLASVSISISSHSSRSISSRSASSASASSINNGGSASSIFVAQTSTPFSSNASLPSRFGSASSQTAIANINFCGNGIINPIELCDDGINNGTLLSNCTVTCQLASLPGCGNGKLGGIEECDDSNTRDLDGCSALCKRELGFCGDSVRQSALNEECDAGTGNGQPTSDCDARCHLVALADCGNGIINPDTELCDDGANNGNFTRAQCRNNCMLPRCGDGLVDPNEECDDGNNVAGDLCNPVCIRVAGGAPLSGDLNGDGRFDVPPPAQTQTGPGLIIFLASGAAIGVGLVRRRLRTS